MMSTARLAIVSHEVGPRSVSSIVSECYLINELLMLKMLAACVGFEK